MKSKTIFEASKDALYRSCEKNIKTTMIGAIAAIEEELKTNLDSDLELQNKFAVIRQRILDNGNRQLRLLDLELERYRIEKLRGFIKLNIT